jgi:hypothetical protein
MTRGRPKKLDLTPAKTLNYEVEIYQKLEECSEIEDRPISNIVRQILREYFEKAYI